MEESSTHTGAAVAHSGPTTYGQAVTKIVAAAVTAQVPDPQRVKDQTINSKPLTLLHFCAIRKMGELRSTPTPRRAWLSHQ